MRRRTFLISVLALPGAVVVQAAENRFKARLVSGGKRDGAWLAGLHIALAPEWKTYWRMPGEAGIPPQFNWSGSVNLKSVTASYPAPGRFQDVSGETIGYHDEVLFPLRIEPVDTTKPVVLKLSLFFAVCKDICIPARAELALDLASEKPDPRVLVWSQRVPQPGSSDSERPVREARIAGQEGSLMLVLNVEGQPTDIFVESDSGAYFGKPKAGTGASEHVLQIANVKDATKLRGKPITVTVTYADKAVEQVVVLD